VSNYTPTTEEVKDALPSGRIYAQFDRWLAEVKAQAWEEGYRDCCAGRGIIANPYRQQT